MTDIKSPEARSRNMSAIKSRDTKPEVYLRKQLFSKGYRYRTNARKISGNPDVYFPKYNTAMFIHGCFWHRHNGCKFAYVPKSRVDFWNAKFDNNVKRDKEVKQLLADQHIKCIIVWECTIKKMQRDEEVREECLDIIEKFLHGSDLFAEV